jgi:hypothetical protein
MARTTDLENFRLMLVHAEQPFEVQHMESGSTMVMCTDEGGWNHVLAYFNKSGVLVGISGSEA